MVYYVCVECKKMMFAVDTAEVESIVATRCGECADDEVSSSADTEVVLRPGLLNDPPDASD